MTKTIHSTKYFQDIEKIIKKEFENESSGHDFYHLKRVFNIAMRIQEKEGGDKLVIGASSLLHDIHRIMQKPGGIFCNPKESLSKIEKILLKIDFPKEKVDQVLHSIEHHEEYSFSKEGKSVFDIETLILQDADNLDAMGAIGVGRCFAFNGVHKLPMWIPEIKYDRKDFNESVNDPSSIHYIESKMLYLYKTINTKTACKIAKQRTDYANKFLETFKKEWGRVE